MKEEFKALEGFQKISLEEIKDVAISDRLETKFIFNKNELPFILAELGQNYKVLEIKNEISAKYENKYFDTPDYELYTRHHNGRTDRFKVRQRKYFGSGETYLEVKRKKQNGRSFKKRIKVEATTTHEIQTEFLKKNLSLDPQKLIPSIKVSYERCTLVNIAGQERITLDTNLIISQNGQNKNFENLVIAEIKQGGKTVSPFRDLMKKRGLREVPLSKYCLGVASLVPGIKRNNFKPLLNSINKQIV